MSKKKVLWGYARTSTPKKDLAEEDLNKQKDNIRKFMNRWSDKYTLKGIEEEALSGRSDNRPIRQKIIDNIDSVDGVIVDHMTRWGRSMGDVVKTVTEITSKGKAFFAGDWQFDPASPTGEIMLKTFAYLADIETIFIVERLKTGRNFYIKAGGKLGRHEKKLSPKELREAKNYYKKGIGFASIAKLLSETDGDYYSTYSAAVIRKELKNAGVKFRESRNPKGRGKKK